MLAVKWPDPRRPTPILFSMGLPVLIWLPVLRRSTSGIGDTGCIEFLGLNHVQSHSYSVFCQEKLVLPLMHCLLPPQASPWEILDEGLSQVSAIWPCCGDVTPPRCPGFKGTARSSKLLLRACDSFQLGTIIDHIVTNVLMGRICKYKFSCL